MAPKTQLDRIEERLEQLCDVLHGKSTEDDPGLVGRVVRLEQTHRAVKWLAGTTVGAAIVAVVSAFKIH